MPTREPAQFQPARQRAEPCKCRPVTEPPDLIVITDYDPRIDDSSLPHTIPMVEAPPAPMAAATLEPYPEMLQWDMASSQAISVPPPLGYSARPPLTQAEDSSLLSQISRRCLTASIPRPAQ